MSDGRGSVWICESCGFIGMYKPEHDEELLPAPTAELKIYRDLGRACPACGAVRDYKYTGDIALVAMETKVQSRSHSKWCGLNSDHEGVCVLRC